MRSFSFAGDLCTSFEMGAALKKPQSQPEPPYLLLILLKTQTSRRMYISPPERWYLTWKAI